MRVSPPIQRSQFCYGVTLFRCIIAILCVLIAVDFTSFVSKAFAEIHSRRHDPQQSPHDHHHSSPDKLHTLPNENTEVYRWYYPRGNDDDDDDGGLSTGAIIGIVVAVVIVLIIISFICCCVRQRMQKRTNQMVVQNAANPENGGMMQPQAQPNVQYNSYGLPPNPPTTTTSPQPPFPGYTGGNPMQSPQYNPSGPAGQSSQPTPLGYNPNPYSPAAAGGPSTSTPPQYGAPPQVYYDAQGNPIPIQQAYAADPNQMRTLSGINNNSGHDGGKVQPQSIPDPKAAQLYGGGGAYIPRPGADLEVIAVPVPQEPKKGKNDPSKDKTVSPTSNQGKEDRDVFKPPK